MTKQIKDCMTPHCHWVTPETTIQETAQLMKDEDLGFVPVGENDKLIGAVTDRDIVIRAVAQNWESTTQVRDAMTPQTFYCYDDDDAQEVCQNMASEQIRRMPVVNRDKKLVGVVSFGDLAQAANHKTVGACEQEITWQTRNNHSEAA